MRAPACGECGALPSGAWLAEALANLTGAPHVPGSEADSLPDGSGVYIFREGGRWLYVGSARTLRNRVRRHCPPTVPDPVDPGTGRNCVLNLAREILGDPSRTWQGAPEASEVATRISRGAAARPSHGGPPHHRNRPRPGPGA